MQRCKDATAPEGNNLEPFGVERGGSVRLNSFEPFRKRIFRSVMPRPILVAMGRDMPDRASVRPTMNAVSLSCRTPGTGAGFPAQPRRCRKHADNRKATAGRSNDRGLLRRHWVHPHASGLTRRNDSHQVAKSFFL